MSPKRREMHFGVFVLGTGNHSAGSRYDGAATSNNDLSVIQEIARHAERGKFDLLFVSDGRATGLSRGSHTRAITLSCSSPPSFLADPGCPAPSREGEHLTPCGASTALRRVRR